MPSVDVATDPDLSPKEQEVTIGWSKGEDSAVIHSDLPAIARWLIRNNDADILDRRTVEGTIVSVKARLPVSALKLSGHLRKSTTPSSVVGSLPDD